MGDAEKDKFVLNPIPVKGLHVLELVVRPFLRPSLAKDQDGTTVENPFGRLVDLTMSIRQALHLNVPTYKELLECLNVAAKDRPQAAKALSHLVNGRRRELPGGVSEKRLLRLLWTGLHKLPRSSSPKTVFTPRDFTSVDSEISVNRLMRLLFDDERRGNRLGREKDAFLQTDSPFAHNTYDARADLAALGLVTHYGRENGIGGVVIRSTSCIPFAQVRRLHTDATKRPDVTTADGYTLTRSGRETINLLNAGSPTEGTSVANSAAIFVYPASSSTSEVAASVKAFQTIAERLLSAEAMQRLVLLPAGPSVHPVALHPFLRMVWHEIATREEETDLVEKLGLADVKWKGYADHDNRVVAGALAAFPSLLIQRHNPDRTGSFAFTPDNVETSMFLEWRDGPLRDAVAKVSLVAGEILSRHVFNRAKFSTTSDGGE